MDPLWGASPSVESFSLDLHGLFVGREAELGRLRQLFEDGAPGVVVFGPAGTGKTALAEVFAFRGKEGFPGGIFRLTASDAENPQHLLERAFGEEFDKPTSVTAGTLLIVNNAETIDERGQRTLRADPRRMDS